MGFKTFYSPEDSIKLIAKAIKMGQLDPEDDNTRTVKYYQYLIDAHALLKDIMIDGRLF